MFYFIQTIYENTLICLKLINITNSLSMNIYKYITIIWAEEQVN